MTGNYRITRGDLSEPAILSLLQLHLDEMHQWSPPGSVHALPAEKLAAPDVTFFAAWDDENLAAVGAIKGLEAEKGELKSMRAAPGYRGKGAGKALLVHLLEVAQERGYRWVGLETGRPDPFRPAQRLYREFGFVECKPFGDYVSDDFSMCMERAPTMIGRRELLGAMGATGIAACVPIDTSRDGRLSAQLRIIEAASGGMLGVAMLDTVSGRTVGYRSQTRFGHCSSFKLSLAALTLAAARRGTIDGDQLVRWTEGDLLAYAPFTRERLNTGATIFELARAAQTVSDNTAANLLLARLGGPEGLTAFWRDIGDMTSRLDRTEPELNVVPPSEVRDTSTPAAMASTVAKLIFGEVLEAQDRATLRQWTIDTATGAKRVRAGLPQNWGSGDKTGTSFWPGMGSLYVDIGWAVAPARNPVTFAAYYRADDAHSAIDPAAEKVLAQVGLAVADFALG